MKLHVAARWPEGVGIPKESMKRAFLTCVERRAVSPVHGAANEDVMTHSQTHLLGVAVPIHGRVTDGFLWEH